MLTVGAVVSLATVTVIGAEVVRWPAASRATAVKVCEPLVVPVVFHGALNGALVTSVPGLPSRKNCTPVTAVSSSALALTVIVPETVSPEAGELMLTVGGVLSLATVTVTGADVVRLPAASRATAVRVCEPLVVVLVFHGAEYGAVVTSVPALPSRKNCTPTTAVSSAALTVTVIVPEMVSPETGEVMLTVGAAASKRTLLSVLVEAVLPLPAASCAAPAAMLTVTVPLVVMPPPAIVDVLGPPLTVALLLPPAVAAMNTSGAVKPLTASLNTAVKVIGLAPVGSA